MAILNTGIRAVTRRMPKVISPRVHGFIDYGITASFFIGAAILWKDHRRASIAAMACGAAELATVLNTDFPAGIHDGISFQKHGKIESALAGVVGTMPTLLRLKKPAAVWFFRSRAIGMTTVAGLTDWERETSLEGDGPRRLSKRAA